MADEATTHTVEKIYCPTCDSSSNTALNPILSALLTNQNQHDPMMSAMLANGNQNQMFNNPWAYIMMMWLFRMMGPNWGGAATDNYAENANSRAIATLQDTVNQNQLNQTVMDALSNNQAAIRELAQTFNTDINTIQQACCGINASIKEVGGQIGYSAESVKNAIALGDSNIISAVNTSACATQKAILEQGYQSQLATERQTNILGGQVADLKSSTQLQTCQQTNTLANAIADLKSTNQLGQFQMQSALGNQINDARNAMVNGFSQVGYAAQQNTQAIIANATANTQRILDQMCANSQQELRDKLAQMSQDAQTAQIVNQLRSGCGCNS